MGFGDIFIYGLNTLLSLCYCTFCCLIHFFFSNSPTIPERIPTLIAANHNYTLESFIFIFTDVCKCVCICLYGGFMSVLPEEARRMHHARSPLGWSYR